jgi:hypothetical protein
VDFSFLTNAFNYLFEKLNDILTWFGNLFKAVFIAIWNVLLDGVCYAFETLGTFVSALASLLPADSTLQNWSQYWGQVPTAVMEVCIAVGIVPALAIVTIALGIRLALQLIPFVRLGS